jgi:hypothetical protein
MNQVRRVVCGGGGNYVRRAMEEAKFEVLLSRSKLAHLDRGRPVTLRARFGLCQSAEDASASKITFLELDGRGSRMRGRSHAGS